MINSNKNEKNLDGRVFLDISKLKINRRKMGLSQMGFAEYSTSIRKPISIASIKRAELGHPVIYRTALILAKLYQVEVTEIIAHEEPLENKDEPFTILDANGLVNQQEEIYQQGEFHYINFLISKSVISQQGCIIYVRSDDQNKRKQLIENVLTKFAYEKNEIIEFKCGSKIIVNFKNFENREEIKRVDTHENKENFNYFGEDVIKMLSDQGKRIEIWKLDKTIYYRLVQQKKLIIALNKHDLESEIDSEELIKLIKSLHNSSITWIASGTKGKNSWNEALALLTQTQTIHIIEAFTFQN